MIITCYELSVLIRDHMFSNCRLFLFGAGRRVCVGENLTRNRLFLFMATILQRFNLTSADEMIPDPDPRTYESAIVLTPKKYLIHAKCRE